MSKEKESRFLSFWPHANLTQNLSTQIKTLRPNEEPVCRLTMLWRILYANYNNIKLPPNNWNIPCTLPVYRTCLLRFLLVSISFTHWPIFYLSDCNILAGVIARQRSRRMTEEWQRTNIPPSLPIFPLARPSTQLAWFCHCVKSFIFQKYKPSLENLQELWWYFYLQT